MTVFRMFWLFMCLVFSGDAFSETREYGVLLNRFECFQPTYYECNTLAQFDVLLERLTGWDVEARKLALSYNHPSVVTIGCNNALLYIGSGLIDGSIKSNNKRDSVLNIAKHLLSFTSINKRKETFVNGKHYNYNQFEILTAIGWLKILYIGDWKIYLSQDNVSVAQCYYGVISLVDGFAAKSAEDAARFTWRKARRADRPYTLDVLERAKVGDFNGLYDRLDLQIALYWIRRSSGKIDYSRQIWSQLSPIYSERIELYNKILDN